MLALIRNSTIEHHFENSDSEAKEGVQTDQSKKLLSLALTVIAAA
jgi:hypothetical protein